MKLKRQWLMVCVLSFSIPCMALAETLIMDSGRSSIEFSVSNFGVHQVHGHFKIQAGKIEYDDKSPTKSVVIVAVQADSIDTNNPKRDHHLKSSDFFDTARFPQISYVSQSIQQAGDHYVMQGALVMKNIIKPVPVIFTFEATHQANGKTLLKAHGQASIKRDDFSITYGNGFMVGHNVNIDLTVEAQ